MAQLTVQVGEEKPLIHELPEEDVTVGRVEDNTLCLAHDSVSSHHAKLLFSEGKYSLVDLGSTNGTTLNGNPIGESPAPLGPGDLVRFGSVDCVFEAPEQHQSPDTARPLPEKSLVDSRTAAETKRPANFVSSSPIPKVQTPPDPLRPVLLTLGGIAAIALVLSAILALLTSI